MAPGSIYSCSFEVYGKVQNVKFLGYTQVRADELKLHGWCTKTNKNTIVGRIEGPLASVYRMRQWLQNKGSPESKITGAKFSSIKDVGSYKYAKFSVVYERM